MSNPNNPITRIETFEDKINGGWRVEAFRLGGECEISSFFGDDEEPRANAYAAWIRTPATARTEARKAALEEAAKLAETPGIWKPHPDIPDCFRIATAIRAMMEKEG